MAMLIVYYLFQYKWQKSIVLHFIEKEEEEGTNRSAYTFHLYKCMCVCAMLSAFVLCAHAKHTARIFISLLKSNLNLEH